MEIFNKYLSSFYDDKLVHNLVIIVATIASYSILSIRNNPLFSYIYHDSQIGLLSSIRTVYQLSLLLIAFMTFISMYYSISQRKNEIFIYLIHGMTSSSLFSYLVSLYLPDLLISFLIGLPIGIVANELISLIIIGVLNLNLSKHSFKISFKAMVICLLALFIIELIAIVLTSVFNNKKYPDSIFKKVELHLISKLGFAITICYALTKLYPQVFYILGESILPLVLIGTAILLIRLLFTIIKPKKNILLMANLRSFFKTNAFSIIFYCFITCFGLIFLFDGITDYYVFYKNSTYRPDFTIYDDISKIDGIYNKDIMVEEILPVVVGMANDIDDTNLESLIKKNYDYYFHEDSATVIMPFSHYKKLYPDSDIKPLAKDETIFLFYSPFSYTNLLDQLTKISKEENTKIGINGHSYKIVKIDQANSIFANDEISYKKVYIVNDDSFEDFKAEITAYNIYLSDYYVKEYGYSKAANMFRDDLFETGVRFESLVWLLDKSYLGFLTSIIIYIYVFVILSFVAISFLGIRILSFIDENKSNYQIIGLLGEEKATINKMINLLTSIVFLSQNLLIIAIFFLYSNTRGSKYQELQYLYKQDGKGVLIILIVLFTVIGQFLFLNFISNNRLKSYLED